MADQWYYAQDDRKLGPFSAQELRALADAGRIQAMDTIWKEGIEHGVLAYRVKNLFAPPPADAFSDTENDRPVVPPGPEPSGTAVQVVAPPAPPPVALLLQQDHPATGTEQKEALTAALPAPENGVATEFSSSLDSAAEAASGEGQILPAAAGEASPPGECPPQAGESAPQEAPKPTAPKLQTKHKARAISAKGAILGSQNGTTVQFQKKCTECGYLDPSKSTMPIRSGTSRTTFFCRKCRKLRHVEIQGIV
jgi:hypothetical protein